MKDLIYKLKANNIHVFLDNDVLKVKYNDGHYDEGLLEEIKKNKPQIIDYLKMNWDGSVHQSIPVVTPQSSYVLSSSQHRLWVTCQYHEANIAYNIPRVEVFEGTLDLTALHSAFKALVARHETLRTVFKEDEQGSIRQWVTPVEEHTFSLKYHDLRKFENPAIKQALLDDLIKEEKNKAFDLSSDSLLRAAVFQVEENKSIICYVIHHIISDGWSLNIMVKELMSLFMAYSQGRESVLPPLRIQYKDYAAWQQARLEDGQLKNHKEYWLSKMDGELPVLKLTGDRPRPAIKTYNGQKVSKSFNKDVIKGLKKACSTQGATMFMGLLAGVNLLLYKYTNQNDIIIGSPIAGREHTDLEDQLGFYLNTLALRTQFMGKDSFTDLLDNIKKVSLDAFEHQAYPFDELVNDLPLKRDVSRNPLFDVAMVFQNTGIAGKNIKTAAIENINISSYGGPSFATSKFDLSFDFLEAGDELILHLEFNSDIFNRSTVEGMLAHLEQLFTAAVGAPKTPIVDLEYLTDQQVHQLLVEFNPDKAKYQGSETISSLFEEQVAAKPGNIAVQFGEKALTYAELNEYSNQLAFYLKEVYNIKSGDPVGIMLHRTDWMVVAIMGVLKSGAAYVPIDQDYPKERINYIKEDTGCKVIIDADEVETFVNQKEKYSTDNPRSVITPNDLAYVMYTSGSTGKPKGIMVEHKSVVRLVKQSNYVSVSDNDAILGISNYSFDGSVFDIFGSLLNGAKLVIPSKDAILDIKKLDEIISKGEISIVFVTTALFNVIVDSQMKSFGQLKYVLFGGEQVSISHVNKFLDNYSKVNLVHVYGPTECTTFSTYYPVKDVIEKAATVPIGKGISNTYCYILSKELKLQPVGIVGEIFIGGDGLARGYWNNEKMTAEKFINNPFEAGERMYSTGDLGRWTPEGNIEFMGREDDQVKIRGFRIELAEIEQALLSYQGVKTAVVTVKEDVRSEKSLVAYIVSGDVVSKSDLRLHLKQILPAYMIPDFLIQIESLPLTVNGKVDKKLLPAPESLNTTRIVEYVAPRNEREVKLVEIWSEILGLEKEKIGIKDNFFDLGGHSLKAIRLKNRINKEFALKYDLKGLYVESTIELIAEKIRLDEWLKVSESENDSNYNEIKV